MEGQLAIWIAIATMAALAGLLCAIMLRRTSTQRTRRHDGGVFVGNHGSVRKGADAESADSGGDGGGE